jgi:hypothetical protein
LEEIPSPRTGEGIVFLARAHVLCGRPPSHAKSPAFKAWALEEANRYLHGVYIDYWNDPFTVEPAVAKDMHRKVGKNADLEVLFAETLTGTVQNDFTIRHKNRRWQIPKSQARGIRLGHKVTVENRLDGSVHFRVPSPDTVQNGLPNSSPPLLHPKPQRGPFLLHANNF